MVDSFFRLPADELVYFFLSDEFFTNMAADSAKLFGGRKSHVVKVGGIDLGVSVELTKINIQGCRIEKGPKNLCQDHVDTSATIMDVIQVVLESTVLSLNTARIVNTAYTPPPLFL